MKHPFFKNRICREFVPYIVITIIVLIVFSVLCSMRVLRSSNGTPNNQSKNQLKPINQSITGHPLCIDWALSKPWLAIGGVVISSLAVATTHGLLYLCGMTHNEIVNIAPFIVICEFWGYFCVKLSYGFHNI